MQGGDAGGAGGAGASLLIFAPVQLYRGADGRLMLENQACNGLRLWAENFDRVIAVMPLVEGPVPPAWVPLEAVGPGLARIEIETVPIAWRLRPFLKALPAVRRKFRARIAEADYCGFSLGGLVGDWGAVGCQVAHAMGRPFFVWTDRVESQVERGTARTAPTLRRRLKARLTWRAMAALERWAIRRADLGLFHGRETFEAYAPYSRDPQLVHDIHIRKQDRIGPEALAAKVAAAGAGPLRIAYVGRADAMKGPLDWVAVLERLAAKGVDFRAEWLGNGDEVPAMAARIAAAGLGERVALRGFVADRAAVLEAYRGAQVFLFCHRTPESPRNLIEALVSGTVLVGYDGAFARDLIQAQGGGVLRPMGDIEGLAGVLADLAGDRARLAALIGRAAADGAPFNDEDVFRHRSELIRGHLPRR